MLPGSPQKHPGLRLTASAWRLVVMRAIIDCVQPGASHREFATHLRVQGFQLIYRNEPLCDATLVAHYHDEESSLIDQRDSLVHARKKLHILPPRHILPF